MAAGVHRDRRSDEKEVDGGVRRMMVANKIKSLTNCFSLDYNLISSA